jgi:hypothetical protein
MERVRENSEKRRKVIFQASESGFSVIGIFAI